MTRMIFVNLPVADVARSTALYEAIGFVKDPHFSNEQSSAMRWSDAIKLMLLAKPLFATLTSRQITDARVMTTAVFALSFDSRADVDTFTEAAIAAGAREAHDAEDEGFMYSRAFEDFDGHGWGPFWMDPAAAEQGPPEQRSITN